MVRKEYTGGAPSTTLASGISSSDLSFTVDDGSGYPDGSIGPFVIALDRGNGSEEKVLCTARSGNVFTVDEDGRGYDGTFATSHTLSASVDHVLDSESLTDMAAHIYDTERNDHTQYATTTTTDTLSASITSTQSELDAHEAASNPHSGSASTTDFNAHTASTSAHSATASATPNRMVLRDSSGRFKAASPSASSDVAIKSYVDALISGGTVTATVSSLPNSFDDGIKSFYDSDWGLVLNLRVGNNSLQIGLVRLSGTGLTLNSVYIRRSTSGSAWGIWKELTNLS